MEYTARPGGMLWMRNLRERKSVQRKEVPDDQGRPEASGKGREQSYESIVPVKVGNRRAPERKR